MSLWPILTVPIEQEADIVAVRQRARRIAELLGFDTQDQTRIATAVSEVARTTFSGVGRGTARFRVERDALTIRIHGAGRHGGSIPDSGDNAPPEPPPDPKGTAPAFTLAGTTTAATGAPANGIEGAQRLMDGFATEPSADSGHAYVMTKALPKKRAPVNAERIGELTRQLARDVAADPLAVIRDQNQELLRSLQEVKLRQEEASRLNEELERTNKGVVALYAELDRRAAALQDLNATLEQRVATAIAERDNVEENLRQSQKMEAVGQLTGGIAHDFNNMLTGIIGSLEIMQRRIAAGRLDDIARFIDAATTSAQRAAGLTHRLLAFSRRQSLDAKPVDANVLALGMEELLGRTLGENIGLELALASHPWLVEADPNQLESALLNLAINARDAMPDGGTLKIETRHVSLDQRGTEGKPGIEPGDFVVLSVSDTGRGMSNTVIARAFEPFFTTKPVGAGTGLGLSMVYGFVKQSGGHVEIHSQPNRGATVTLFLPRARQEAETVPAAETYLSKRAVHGEAVLIVEDVEAVRMLVTEVLADLGYAYHQASDGHEAVPILSSAARIDLLITDVGLPGMNGRQLAELARQHRPGLKILFITGYAENATSRASFLEPGMEMITKPFAIDVLAAKIRELIGRSDEE